MRFSNWERFVEETINNKRKQPVITPPQEPITEVQAEREQPKKKKVRT